MDIAHKSVRKPAPPLSIGNEVDGGSGHAMKHRKIVGAYAGGLLASNFANILLDKFAGAESLATGPYPMRQHVVPVLDASSPSQVARVHTSFLASAAGVGGLVTLAGCDAVREFAHEVGSHPLPSFGRDDSVSLRFSERPNQAAPVRISDMRLHPFLRGAFGCPACSRISVPTLAGVVRRAKAECVVMFFAMLDRATLGVVRAGIFHPTQYSEARRWC